MSQSFRRAITAFVYLSVLSTVAFPSPAQAVAPVDIRMSAAPSAVRDSQGATWAPAGRFVGGALSAVNSRPVAGTPDPQLFVYERYGMTAWNIDVPSACYDVTLRAREKYFNAPGRRVFSVRAENRTLVSDLDIYRTVGQNRAIEHTFRIPVTDGRLDLAFSAKVNNAIISAIRVRTAGDLAACGASPSPTPTPTPAPTRTPTPSPAPVPQAPPAAGAAPVGSSAYPIPSGALFVSPKGMDSAAGTSSAPLRTVTGALAKLPTGGTIILRAGTYHESVLIPPGKPVTIQPYPGEAVWFDGSRRVNGFSPVGGAWSAPWDTILDSSPTYTRGAPDNTQPDWRFVSKAHPMAAHPDQVWIDDVPQHQVGSRAQVGPGTFYVDTTSKRLVLGTNPSGNRVEAGVLPSAFSLRAPGTILRGFGIRRYVPSVPDFGAVTAFFPRMTLDNMTVLDGSTAGVGIFAAGSTIRSSTISSHGMIGIQASEADDLTLDRVLVTRNNIEHFNHAPVAGGVKICRSRGVTVRDSKISQNDGIGIWFDESVFDMAVLSNELFDNAGSGVMIELSSKALVAGNTILRSGYDALAIRNSNDVAAWNNTLQGAYRALEVSQDGRRPTNNPSALDARHPKDAAMTWVISDISIRNNVLIGGDKGLMTLGVEDFDRVLDATRQRISTDGNVYAPQSQGAPRWLSAWSRPGTDPYAHTNLADFFRVNGQERTGISFAGRNVIDLSGSLDSIVATTAPTVAHPLPNSVAVALGKPAGTRFLGSGR
ncbi:hypothetical protein MOPEL_078_00400 [Mobilicoccus pelagius NBRC 104925]|uniref:Right handed beta helix domain-containing protein n=2 Tax=Mobilicoccus TaxID=984996 RepID=H5USE3_9MICO|nr:hypothetical protein MOPEL_078_00400 [Mobilicoccus pelagius NBRC 104925]